MKCSVIRIFDVVFSVVGLLILWPVMLLLLMAGTLDSGSPLFKQKRLGRNKDTFTLIKFRTMAKNTPSISTHLANPDSVTPFGRILRRTKLDELPQLWNVLRGEMSIVGPRPGLENQVELTHARDQLGVFSVKPGITGLAQLRDIDMSTPELLARTDADMIFSMSVKNYLRYILLTALGKGQGDRLNL